MPFMKNRLLTLKISLVFFLIYNISFSQENKQDSLRKILDSSYIKLKEVLIEGKKPFLESKSDRFIFNIENSSLSIGNNAWDVLRQTPLVNTEQEKLSILGFQNASIYINNRKSILKSKDLYQYLKSMPSDNIVKIEIITSPSAKFDASDGGVINLVLKKTEVDGVKGSAVFSDEQKRKNSQSSNINLNYHHNKYSQSLSFYLGRNNGITEENLTNQNLVNSSTEYISSKDKSKEFRIGGTTSVNYELDEKSIIGGVFELHSSNPKDTELSNNYTLQNNTISNQYESSNINDDRVRMFGSSLFYSYNNEKTEKSLDINLDYFSHNRYNKNDFFSNQSSSNNSSTNIDNDNIKNNYSLKADYSQPLGESGISLETGWKINFLDTKNPYDYKEWNGSEFVNNPLFSNNFHYKENINALYITLQKKFFKKLDINVGLRYENTNIETVQQISNETNKSNSNDFVPTINMNYMINKNNKISLSYRSMIWRPYSNELNPFLFKLNDNYWTSGNSDLHVATIQAIKLNYYIKKSCVFLLSLEKVNNPILNNVEIVDNITLSKPQNFNGEVRRYYLGINYNTSFLKNKISANLSSGLYNIDNSEIYPNNGNSFYNSSSISLNGNNLFYIGLNLSAYFSYRTSYYLANKFNNTLMYNTFDVSKNYKDFKFKIGIIDPFNLINNEYTTYSNTGIFNTNGDYNQRGVAFSIVKTFGNEKTKKTNVDKTDKGRSENGNSTIK
jgi:hypothetical protein